MAAIPKPDAHISDIRDAAERWQQEHYAVEVTRCGERRAFLTDTGVPIKPLYTPADLADSGFDYLADLGFPGEYPFTRGDRAGMYRTEPFVISAYSGFGEAGECN